MPFKKELLPYILTIAAAFIILSGLFYLAFFGNRTKQVTPRPSSSPRLTFSPRPEDIDTQNLQYHPDSSTKVQTIDETSQKMLNKDAAIGQLLTKLPYQGNLFTLDYNYQTNSFTAGLSTINQTQANQEFDQFLKSNQIENQNWLYNLKIVQI